MQQLGRPYASQMHFFPNEIIFQNKIVTWKICKFLKKNVISPLGNSKKKCLARIYRWLNSEVTHTPICQKLEVSLNNLKLQKLIQPIMVKVTAVNSSE